MENLEINEKMKIFISGSAGFIGSNLTRHYAESGEEVGVYLKNTTNIWRLTDVFDSLNVYYGDITDNSALMKAMKAFEPDIVINALTYGGAYGEFDSDRIIDSNLKGTFNLLKSSLSNGAELVLNTSSFAEYGKQSGLVKEEITPMPTSDYAAAKLFSTQYCKYFSQVNDFKAVSLRLFQAYGFFENPVKLVPKIFVSAMTGRSINIRNPNSKRDYVFIDDILRAYDSAIEKRYELQGGEIFNVGSSQLFGSSDLIEIIGNLLDVTLSVTSSMERLRPEDELYFAADISRIKSVLGWKPSVTLKEGLSKYAKWFKSHSSLYGC